MKSLIWDLRMNSKPYWYLPVGRYARVPVYLSSKLTLKQEQFDVDWNKFPAHTDPNTMPHLRQVAGNYGDHSNVWHIGMVSPLSHYPPT